MERKDRSYGRGGGVACYVRNDIDYLSLNNLEVDHLEVIWLKLRPKRLPRRIPCILLACIYYTENTDYITIRDHMLTSIDSVIREHPDCGLVITGDFNQMSDNFLKTHYRLVQVVDIPTRGNAILDKLWSNMADVYCTPFLN